MNDPFYRELFVVAIIASAALVALLAYVVADLMGERFRRRAAQRRIRELTLELGAKRRGIEAMRSAVETYRTPELRLDGAVMAWERSEAVEDQDRPRTQEHYAQPEDAPKPGQ